MGSISSCRRALSIEAWSNWRARSSVSSARRSSSVSQIPITVVLSEPEDTQQRETLRFGCILHDIGKIGIEERMIDARDTDDAAHIFYRMHPLIGRSILRPVTFAQEFTPIVVHHHERWDGSGFPEGLEGEDIPLVARLVAVVDSYERAVNPTESPMPISPEEALRGIVRGAGTAYDPEMVAAFERVMRRRFEEGLDDPEAVGAEPEIDIDALIEEAINGVSLRDPADDNTSAEAGEE